MRITSKKTYCMLNRVIIVLNEIYLMLTFIANIKITFLGNSDKTFLQHSKKENVGIPL